MAKSQSMMPMHLLKFQSVIAAMFFAITAHAADYLKPLFFTNETAIGNGSAVLSAVLSGDTQGKASIRSLLGSQVVFVGSAASGGNANLMVASNVVLDVEIRPSRDVRPQAVTWSAEVLGTLKSADFKKRVIHIRAKPEDWRVRETG